MMPILVVAVLAIPSIVSTIPSVANSLGPNSNALPVFSFDSRNPQVGLVNYTAVSPDRLPPPPPSPSQVSMTFSIFWNGAEADFNGKDYGNGQTSTVTSEQWYSLSFVSTNSSYRFLEWTADAGYFEHGSSGVSTYSSESVYAQYNGVMVLVLNSTQNSSWEGYIAAGNNLRSVSAIFNAPTVGYVARVTNPSSEEGFVACISLGVFLLSKVPYRQIWAYPLQDQMHSLSTM